jgi:hypothetical protein
MSQIYQIIIVIGLFYVGDSSADGLFCKNNLTRNITSKTVYNIEKCTNTEINLGDENAKATIIYVQASNNQISRISDDTFKLARKLTHIDLRMNNIEQISVGAFQDQANLIHLYLKQNKLTRIEVGTFDNLIELKHLWLQNNQLTLIEKGLFDKNVNLEHLFLNENKISMIESTVFEKLKNIEEIHLQGNLCSNKNFQTNKIDPNFTCFKNFTSLLKPLLGQCKLELKNCDALNTELRQQSSELITIGRNLSDCQREISNMSQKIERQPKTLQKSFTMHDCFENTAFIIIAIAGLVILLTIALLISIVKICRLASDNKFLNENLDRLCEDHIYEKVDYIDPRQLKKSKSKKNSKTQQKK